MNVCGMASGHSSRRTERWFYDQKINAVQLIVCVDALRRSYARLLIIMTVQLHLVAFTHFSSLFPNFLVGAYSGAQP